MNTNTEQDADFGHFKSNRSVACHRFYTCEASVREVSQHCFAWASNRKFKFIQLRVAISCLLYFVYFVSNAKADIDLELGDGIISDSIAGVEFKTFDPYGGDIQLLCRMKDKWNYVTESGKNTFHIHHVTKSVIVVTIPVGFCTVAGVYRINEEKGSIDKIYKSCDDRGSVDYKFIRFEKKTKKITFRAFENLSYEETHRVPRLMEEVYVYID